MNSKNSSAPMENPENLPPPELRKYEDSLTVSRLELERYPEHRQVYREALICLMQDKPGVLFMCEESHRDSIIFRALKYPPSLAEKAERSPHFRSGGWYRVSSLLPDVRDAPQSEGVSTPNPISE